MVVEFQIVNQQCETCQKSFTPHAYNAIVQVRQKVPHRRTFCYLEQLILKSDAHAKVTSLKETREGLDFFFETKSHAQRFADFVEAHVPTKSKQSRHLISHDANSNTYNFKYTIMCELCPICVDDVVHVPKGHSTALNGAPPLMLCHKVTNAIRFVDPVSLRSYDIPNPEYWKRPLHSVCGKDHLTEFVVLNVEPLEKPEAGSAARHNLPARGKMTLADVEVARACDLGVNDDRVIVRSHLGQFLRPGGRVMGYDLRTVNVSGLSDEALKGPGTDVVLVKKVYKRNKKRAWDLRRLNKETVEGEDPIDDDADMEALKRDLEEDPELRKGVNMYRTPGPEAKKDETKKEDDPDGEDEERSCAWCLLQSCSKGWSCGMIERSVTSETSGRRFITANKMKIALLKYPKRAAMQAQLKKIPPRLLDQKASKQSAESAESAGFSVEEKAHELLAQLDFHFHCDKDPDCSVSSTECTELLQALKDMRKKLTTLQKDAAVLEEKCVQRANQPRKASKAPASYVEMKVQLLLSYLISLTYYLLLKVKGVSLRDHPVVLRLLWIRTLIEKLKPVDQRLQYQMNKLLQWKDAKAAEQLAGSTDAHALRPGQLVASVQDEDAEDAQEAEELASAPKDEEGHLGAYKPPKISQVEYTGDHISMQERAEKELDRKKARLERSEFMRSLREEFTDAPREIMAEERSARVEKATRMLREQQEFEEDTMQRVKVKKAELRRQKQALREGHATSGGAVSLFDVASDFGEIMRGAGKGKGVLQEYEEAKTRAKGLKESVASALQGAKRSKRSGAVNAKRRRR
ncbi:unnamed protein product [Durusdinium trenchii]|uniref:60S ribosomal export protein NMD3 n=1 Tax=Durusdinium trenchii TaxID=1381693 RepID=A0ABP0LM33_9DINO